MPVFGDKFRKAREAKKLSLDDVSRVTKIGARMLQAIEEEHFDVLPGGVFNRGFIRAYAKHLGLNDEEAVTDYLACLRQAQIDANQFREPAPAPTRTSTISKNPAAPKPAPPKPAPQSHAAVEEVELRHLHLPRTEDVHPRGRSFASQQSSFPSMTILVVIVVILLVALIWTRHTHSNGTRSSTASPSPSSQPAPAASSPTSPLTSATNSSPTATSAPNSPTPKTPSASSPAPSPNAPNPTAPPVTAENKSLDNKSQAPKSDATKLDAGSLPARSSLLAAPSDAKQPAVNTSETSDLGARIPAKPTNAKPVLPMTLVIRASENTWVSVLADGQLVSQETLIAPANTTVHATREITVKVGNAAGVSFLWNNQAIPAQGGEAEVKTLVFDASGMRTTSQNP